MMLGANQARPDNDFAKFFSCKMWTHFGSVVSQLSAWVFAMNSQMGHRSSDSQVGGLHTRLFSRAFVIDNGAKLIAFVSVECAGIDRFVKAKVKRVKGFHLHAKSPSQR